MKFAALLRAALLRFESCLSQFAPLTGLEVVGKRVEETVIIVEVRLNVNLMAHTIEQVISKMQRSHIQMLDTMIDRQRQDLTEEEVGPLLSLMDKAEEKAGDWFNSPEKFELATNAAMMAQRKIIIEGVKNQRLRVVDVGPLRSAANFAAKSNDPTLALQLLQRAEATMLQWSPLAKGPKVELLDDGTLARNSGVEGECVRTMSPLPRQGVHSISVVYEYDGLQTSNGTNEGSGEWTGILKAASHALPLLLLTVSPNRTSLRLFYGAARRVV